MVKYCILRDGSFQQKTIEPMENIYFFFLSAYTSYLRGGHQTGFGIQVQGAGGGGRSWIKEVK